MIRIRRGCTLERRGWPCGLCEADRRERHLAACTREDCWLCGLICPAGGDDTYRFFCVVEYAPVRQAVIA